LRGSTSFAVFELARLNPIKLAYTPHWRDGQLS